MNEKRNNINHFAPDEKKDDLIGLLKSLESRANLLGLFSLAAQIEQLKRTIIKNNMNKKLMKSFKNKYETYKQQLEMLEQSKQKGKSK